MDMGKRRLRTRMGPQPDGRGRPVHRTDDGACTPTTNRTSLGCSPTRKSRGNECFMPYAEVGYVKNATKDALLNMEVKEAKAKSSRTPPELTRTCMYSSKGQRGRCQPFDKVISISPAEPFQAEFAAEGLKGRTSWLKSATMKAVSW